MSFRLHRSASAESEVHRVLSEENRKALVLLENWRQDPAEHIHRARQSCKRCRALLRTFRASAPYVFDVENRFYRDLARSLSCARDTEAVVEAVELLEERIWEPGPREALGMLRTGLKQRAAAEVNHSIAELETDIATACQSLKNAETRLARLPLRGLRRRDLKRGVRKSFGRAAHAFAQAAKSPTDQALHKWRRQVKYSYYQTRLMRDLMPRWSRQFAAPLDELAEQLGHYQDLVVLQKLLNSLPDDLGIDEYLLRLRGIIQRAQLESRQTAIAIGRKIFESEPEPRANVIQLPSRRARV